MALIAFAESGGCLPWPRSRLRFDGKRDDAGRHGRRHAGAAQAQVAARRACPVDLQRRVLRRRACCRGTPTDTRRSPGATMSGFANASYQRRSARTERRHLVVGPGRRALREQGADRDRRRRVARRGDAGVAGLARDRVDAAVAGRHDDHEAGARRLLDGLDERIGGGGLEDRVTDREIDDVDAAGADGWPRCTRWRGTTSLVRPWPGRVEHLEHREARVRGDAGVLPARQRAVAGDQPGHVRAVAVVVVRGGAAKRRRR